jgi:diguanylate cyclase (GGDEF)-like protein
MRLVFELYWAERKLSREDFLTGALNRRGFMELLEYEGKRSRRSNNALTVVSLDLDGFKLINDKIGFRTGDLVLKVVAETLKKTLRGMDSVARFGGDEFGVLLPETNARNTHVVMEK